MSFPPDDRDPYIPEIDINEATAPDADRPKVVRAIRAGALRRAAIFDLAQCGAGPFRPCACYPV